ncbi:MAG: hypothetical protein LKE46_12355 [Clostridium sp.]|jgi:flagellar basal body-associated protein FliL|uniref:hypothetical protein n=1 Tax=Clostridium sp. TaxID=1506 RepID=UPI0025BC5DCC|nr:hypothetical protein [Clostridium sp.]MCH3965052.1 hypothetical protein [Clostridium sp.]MCI1714273.1 hypothetical protein [Clostridium sp.]MCI1798535.1 hypothetical protein [Clostridium sp.]MCI1812734.1 hypothetical protein [Clostridium sp.]MCI1869344.1 hypothetical protein [Clostridium sp.]
MKKAKSKIVAALIVIIIAAAVVFFSLVFWNSSYSVKEYKFSPEVVDKIMGAQKDGGIIKLDSEEVNELISPLFGKSRTSGDITVKGVNADITNNTLKFYIPVTYRKLNFLLTSEGRAYLKNDRIIYDPSYSKLGKINIPENYVLGKLSGKLNSKLKAEGGVISMPSSVVPIKVESIGVQNKMLLMDAARGGMSIEQKLKWFKDTIDSSENTGQDQNGSVGKNSVQNSSGNGTSQPGKTASSGEKNQNSGETASDNEQAVISEILSAINSRDEAALVSAQADYEKLSPEGKKRVKAAVTSNLDEDTLKKIQEKLN